MNAANPNPCELLPWDTEFFGFRLARVYGGTLQPELAEQIDDWCRNNRIRGLYFLSRTDDLMTIQTAEQHGFGLVDIRVTFDRALTKADAPVRSNLPAGFSIRPVQVDDLPGLQTMARAGHRDTRFFTDGHFPHHRAEDLYSTWITLESQGRAQVVFAAATGQQPLGYVSCHLDNNRQKGQIGLIGVAQEVRGRGLGQSLVHAALDWFRNQGAQEVKVITQGKNQGAQRLYQKCGFQSRRLELWYHKWYPI